jgi:hypothetical protein
LHIRPVWQRPIRCPAERKQQPENHPRQRTHVCPYRNPAWSARRQPWLAGRHVMEAVVAHLRNSSIRSPPAIVSVEQNHCVVTQKFNVRRIIVSTRGRTIDVCTQRHSRATHLTGPIMCYCSCSAFRPCTSLSNPPLPPTTNPLPRRSRLRMCFVLLHIPYTRTALERALGPLRRDLARRTLRICSLYASCPA